MMCPCPARRRRSRIQETVAPPQSSIPASIRREHPRSNHQRETSSVWRRQSPYKVAQIVGQGVKIDTYNRINLSWHGIHVCNNPETCPSHHVFKAAKAHAQGRAALGRYPLIGSHPGQCLVSDGFETTIGRADKAKPIQTKKLAIHTLGQRRSFGIPLNRVCYATVNRHSAPKVG